MATFGEVSYEDDLFGSSGQDRKQQQKDLFLRLVDGNNEVRLVTAPYQYLIHKYKKEPNNPRDFGQKVGCSAIHGSCQLCDAGDKAKPRWYFGVIDRKTGTYKVLDVSYAVFQDIRKLARNERWGDPTKYDIDIMVDKKGGATGYYTVMPIGKEPLSASDQVLKDNADLEDLKRRCTPPTIEQVQKRLDRINGVDAGQTQQKPQQPAQAQRPVQQAPVQQTKAVDMSSDLDDEFPAFSDDDISF